MKMKQCMALFCIFALLVCLCFGCSSVSSEQRAVVNDYKSRLRQAVWSDDLIGLKVGSYQPDTVTDPEQIEQWLTMLNKIKVECVPFQLMFGAPTEIIFVYAEEEVELGGFIETDAVYIKVGYASQDNTYMLRIVNWEDVKEEFTTLKNETTLFDKIKSGHPVILVRNKYKNSSGDLVGGHITVAYGYTCVNGVRYYRIRDPWPKDNDPWPTSNSGQSYKRKYSIIANEFETNYTRKLEGLVCKRD